MLLLDSSSHLQAPKPSCTPQNQPELQTTGSLIKIRNIHDTLTHTERVQYLCRHLYFVTMNYSASTILLSVWAPWYFYYVSSTSCVFILLFPSYWKQARIKHADELTVPGRSLPVPFCSANFWMRLSMPMFSTFCLNSSWTCSIHIFMCIFINWKTKHKYLQGWLRTYFW